MKKKERETLSQQGAADLVEREKELREASWPEALRIACEGLRESLTWPASGRTST